MVRDLDQLRARLAALRAALEPAFRPDTAAPGFHGTTPSTGHCAAAALIINEELGGEMLSTGLEGASHWFNRIKNGDDEVDVDIPGDQFGHAPLRIAAKGGLYTDGRARSRTDISVETLSRAHRLARRSGLTRAAGALQQRVREKELTK